MKYFSAQGGQDEPFIGREVELDLRPAARSRRDGTAVGNLALAVGLAAGIVVDIELQLVGRNVQAGLFRNPSHDLLEHRLQKLFVKMILIAQRKIQVF